MYQTTPTVSALGFISEGAAGIGETLRIMGRFVRDGKKSSEVRETALRLVRACPPKNYSCEVAKIHAFVRDEIRYVQDISDVETVATAVKTLESRSGDCDDKSVLLCALLESIGHKTRFIAIGFEPGIFSHVYAETLIGRNWIPLETTEDVNVGWEPDPQAVQAIMRFHN